MSVKNSTFIEYHDDSKFLFSKEYLRICPIEICINILDLNFAIFKNTNAHLIYHISEQPGQHFADDILNAFSLKKDICIVHIVFCSYGPDWQCFDVC